MNKKIAIVHDDFIQWGGAERLVSTLAEIFPDAPIFTSMYDHNVLSKGHINEDRVITSFLQRLPLKKKLNKMLFSLYPIAFERFDFSDYDIVISSSARFAHGILTKPSTIHISYVNSPFRGFWEPKPYFGNSLMGKFVQGIFVGELLRLRMWDYIAAQRANIVFGNSRTVVNRINKYYKRKAEVFYPYVDFARFDKSNEPKFPLPDRYFVIVSRLVEWKRIDVAIKACQELNIHLFIIGTGKDRSLFEKLSGPTIHFLGFVPDAETTYIISHAQALIHPQKEDFGMTVLEANYCGTPVLAFGEGGATETVIPGGTGELFTPQTSKALAEIIQDFDKSRYAKNTLYENAYKFRKEIFIDRWHEIINTL